ncbi:MAG: helix-hairpin-helix domain-containing protein [Deltaproteobacteria bacterium]|nr:helix-hairpin-helix domain-containing protein [Deltaproteobacteria bacterium]
MSTSTSTFRSFLSVLVTASLLTLALPGVASARPGAPPSRSAEKAVTATGVVNINTAGVTELMRLPRVGPSLAERIVEYRTRTPFKRTVELARVKGIGLKTVRRLGPWLAISGPTTLDRKLVLPKQKPGEAGADAGDEVESR